MDTGGEKSLRYILQYNEIQYKNATNYFFSNHHGMEQSRVREIKLRNHLNLNNGYWMQCFNICSFTEAYVVVEAEKKAHISFM